MIMMPYGRCRSSLQLTGTQTSGTPHVPDPEGKTRWHASKDIIEWPADL